MGEKIADKQRRIAPRINKPADVWLWRHLTVHCLSFDLQQKVGLKAAICCLFKPGSLMMINFETRRFVLITRSFSLQRLKILVNAEVYEAWKVKYLAFCFSNEALNDLSSYFFFLTLHFIVFMVYCSYESKRIYYF